MMMNPASKWTASVLLSIAAGMPVLLMAGCSANKKPSKLETALANAAKDVVIPIEAQNVKNPAPAGAENIQEGRNTFLQQCALCHASDGRAETKLGMAMYPPAMDLNSPHVQRWTDAELFWIIQNGVRLTGMPAFKTMVSEQDTWKVVDFIHALPKSAANPEAQHKEVGGVTSQAELAAYGRKLYRQEGCVACHQLDGEGGTVGPDLTVEGRRGRSDDWLVGHFKDPSAYTPGSIMFSFKHLTDEQLLALTTFLQNEKGPESK
ncbi:MAG TPA: c-type cytochrome [Acidobacteriaceae bacterium]|jgi:mono/diheme cytochrome c family protein